MTVSEVGYQCVTHPFATCQCEALAAETRRPNAETRRNFILDHYDLELRFRVLLRLFRDIPRSVLRTDTFDLHALDTPPAFILS